MRLKRKGPIIAVSIVILGLLLRSLIPTMNTIYGNDNFIASDYDSYGLDKCEETIESEVYKGHLKLSGSYTIWRYNSDADVDLKVPYKLLVKSGKGKLVLISSNNTVTNLIENTKNSPVNESSTITIPIKKGNNSIKIVGYKKADITVELNINKGEFLKLNS